MSKNKRTLMLYGVDVKYPTQASQMQKELKLLNDKK